MSGRPFADYLRDEVIAPLGMVDTDFHVRPDLMDRFCACYVFDRERKLRPFDDSIETAYARPPAIPSGGGGLVSTAADYHRFCRMILNGGELMGGAFGRKTVALMASNHLNGDLAAMGTPRFAETTYTGIGFGLGFSVMLDPARAQIVGTPGEIAGAAWPQPPSGSTRRGSGRGVDDPARPSSALPIRKELRVLTYAALVD